MSWRVALGVIGAWVAITLIIGIQGFVGSSLMASATQPATSLGASLRSAAVPTLPWIPVSLAAIVLAIRFPIGRATWRRHLSIHLAAALLLAFVANILVVLGYWAMGGQFRGVEALVRAAAMWATIRLHLALLIYAAVVAITQTVIAQRRARARELHFARVEGQLARAQLQALNAQIRPHFLFNTLHTIGQLWRSGRSDDADAVLDSLGTLFHKVQASTSNTLVPLGEELAMVREYLSIEERRFQDRLRVTIAAPDSVLACPVPPLVLQPIVENAIRHGISKASSAGNVDVTAARENGNLILTVRDDGPGLGAESRELRATGGVGLSNTRERLAQLYGARASLTLEPGAAGGTIVTISIPVDA